MCCCCTPAHFGAQGPKGVLGISPATRGTRDLSRALGPCWDGPEYSGLATSLPDLGRSHFFAGGWRVVSVSQDPVFPVQQLWEPFQLPPPLCVSSVKNEVDGFFLTLCVRSLLRRISSESSGSSLRSALCVTWPSLVCLYGILELGCSLIYFVQHAKPTWSKAGHSCATGQVLSAFCSRSSAYG